MPKPIPFVAQKPVLRRKRQRGQAFTPPTSVLTLISADWNYGDGYLYLSFDRAVDISELSADA